MQNGTINFNTSFKKSIIDNFYGMYSEIVFEKWMIGRNFIYNNDDSYCNLLFKV